MEDGRLLDVEEEGHDQSHDGEGATQIAAVHHSEHTLSMSVDIEKKHSQENSTIVGQGQCFYYGMPLYEETGAWIPVSVPPMSIRNRNELMQDITLNGDCFPLDALDWNQFITKDHELTMWDVVVEMLLAAREKVSGLGCGEAYRSKVNWISANLLEQSWKEMAFTLTESNNGKVREILETEPPKWLVDSSASSCMLCAIRFHPIMCSRHHCRFCGGIFCGECSRGRLLLPAKFRSLDPERVCDVCCVKLESVQPYLMDQVSRAAQLPTHDLTDLSTLRSWLNFPWGHTMEYEIYKAANIIRTYNKLGSRKFEKSIPDSILKHAKGLAILTIAKVGLMVTYNIGTGLIVARRDDGSWSPPSAISSLGVGWGPQGGGKLTDFIIVLRTIDAVKTFSGNAHFSFGTGLSAAAGFVGRTAEVDVRAGDGGCAACYTYSCCKGAFVGCSIEGNIVATRHAENSRFYGSSLVSASDILLGLLPKPPAAVILYQALSDLYEKMSK